MESSNQHRIIVLVDMDCFYVQVEQKLCPEYDGKPCAVVQYKTWKGGGIIAVNYEARAKGVSRMLRGDEAVKLCPDIHLFRVPEVRGKADLTRYREAGAKVLEVVCEYSDCVERASIDEAYLDMTSVINTRMQDSPPVTADQLPNTFVVGWENEDPVVRKVELQKWLQMIYEEEHMYNERMLALAAVIVEEMRDAVYQMTGYRCSAGVAHNKMLAKLSCGIHKPDKQTVLPQSSIQLLFNTIPIKKVRNLGGKFGEEVVKKFNAEKMGDLFHIPKAQFVTHFGEKNGLWLYNLSRGIENEPVTARQLPKSIGCGKNFPGKTSLSTKSDVIHWLKQLSIELAERLEKDQESNRRIAHLMTISIRNHDTTGFSMVSRSCPIYVYDPEKLAHDALATISKLNTSTSESLWKPSIWTLSMAASKFEDKVDKSHCNDIKSYFNTGKKDNSETLACGSKSTHTDICEKQNRTSLNKSIIPKFPKKDSILNFFINEQSCDSKPAQNVDGADISKSEDDQQNVMLSACCDAMDSLEKEDGKSNPSSGELFVTDETLTDHSVENIDQDSGHNSSHSLVKIEVKKSDDGSEKKTDHDLEHSSQNSIEIENTLNCSEVNTVQASQQSSKYVIDIIDNSSNVGYSEKLIDDANIHLKENCDKLTLINTVVNTATDENSNESVLNKSKPPIMGFFARKLAERSKIISDGVSGQVSILLKTGGETSENISSNFLEKSDCNNAGPSTLVSNTSVESTEYTDLDPELTKLCDRCQKKIPVWEEEEHFDYHMALDLSKEFSVKPPTKLNTSVVKTVVTNTKSKRGKKRGNMTKTSAQSKKTAVQSNTLDSFFKHI